MNYLFKKVNWLFVVMITILIFSRVLFYTLIEVPILSLGFLFDVVIDIGLISLLSFLFKGAKGRKISYTIMLVGYIVVFIADYMYYKSGINKIASITALYSAGFVDMGAYGIKINFYVILFVLFGLSFLAFMFWYKDDNKIIKRNKLYLVLSFILFIPYIYTFSIASQEYDDYISYLKSDTKIFNDLDRSYYMFLEKFGYSVFRYEDTNRSIEVIIESITEAE